VIISPPHWTSRELERERLLAIDAFRKARLDEPLGDYLDSFDEYQGTVEELLETTLDLSEWDSSSLQVLTDPKLLEALRYIAAPPMSADDLKVLSEVVSFAKGRLKENPADVRRIVDTIRSVMDRRRFIWVSEDREPKEAEKAAAVLASAALMAASRAQTNRRTLSKKLQEDLVMEKLGALRMKKVKTRHIKTFSNAPSPGEFCGECKVGTRKADIVVRLWDDRLMPIECKVSNSALNSVKRLNNDAAVKAGTWRKEFGEAQILPMAVLAGVYDLSSLESAQRAGLGIIWAHNLVPLTEFIADTQRSK
jgi:hypothetical protein